MEDASKKNLAETSYLGTYYNCRKIRGEDFQETNFLYLHVNQFLLPRLHRYTHKHGNLMYETSI